MSRATVIASLVLVFAFGHVAVGQTPFVDTHLVPFFDEETIIAGPVPWNRCLTN